MWNHVCCHTLVTCLYLTIFCPVFVLVVSFQLLFFFVSFLHSSLSILYTCLIIYLWKIRIYYQMLECLNNSSFFDENILLSCSRVFRNNIQALVVAYFFGAQVFMYLFFNLMYLFHVFFVFFYFIYKSFACLFIYRLYHSHCKIENKL